MTWPVTLATGRVNLFVKERIEEWDARRQEATAHALLDRLAHQPGVILADEVGMGKTFVALTVALAAAWGDEKQRPVVIMIPSSLKEKWPGDYEVFRTRCVVSRTDREVSFAQATNGLDFVRFLAAPKESRPRIIFLTHGALSRNLDDPWLKLAILKRAMRGKRLGQRRSALPRFASTILRVKSKYRNDRLFEQLLNRDTPEWNRIIDTFNNKLEPLRNSAVPSPIARVLERDTLDLTELRHHLHQLPARATENIAARLDHIRRLLNAAFRRIWHKALELAEFRSPLVILDEAHHLKNPKTDLASLFVTKDADEDAAVLGGALADGFERMLFLTATPFQLGHGELLNVLDRFRGVNWKTLPLTSVDRFTAQCKELRQALDHAQRTALDFDNCWKRIRPNDIVGPRGDPVSHDAWWRSVCAKPEAAPDRVQENHRAYLRAKEALAAAERLLKPWVVRHLRDRVLPNTTVPRRIRILGNGICSGDAGDATGLPMTDSGLLPFLLAARAQSIVAHVARAQASRSASRATFAEGLASSYEAFLETRKGTASVVDDVGDAGANEDPRIRSYIKRLTDQIPGETERANHPKLAPVVERVARLWEEGEKVVVFCHYRVTGRVLVRHISTAILRRLSAMAQRALAGTGHDPGRVLRSWDGAFDRGKRLERALRERVSVLLSRTSLSGDERASMVDIVRRFVRTQLFLIRYVDLSAKDRVSALEEALMSPRGSELSLSDKLRDFVTFISERCTQDERTEYLAALESIHPGGTELVHDDAERYKGADASPSVRLASGAVRSATRRRLLLGFNTPFLPEVLVASSVMAEGVDLHLNCRHMIHHDLAWNPSTIEQRTGRIDRIGAKAEHVGRSIEVALPYVGGTQDEKMYRVVMDRERWFHIIMGEAYAMDELSTERAAERVPLPDLLCQELTMRLEVFNGECSDRLS